MRFRRHPSENSQQVRGRPRKTIHIFHVCFLRLGVPPRPPLTEIEDRRACDSDRRVTVNNIQVILVYGRPGDRARWSVMTTGRLEPIKETGEETGEEKKEAPKEKCFVC